MGSRLSPILAFLEIKGSTFWEGIRLDIGAQARTRVRARLLKGSTHDFKLLSKMGHLEVEHWTLNNSISFYDEFLWHKFFVLVCEVLVVFVAFQNETKLNINIVSFIFEMLICFIVLRFNCIHTTCIFFYYYFWIHRLIFS